jgi:hypothetical protein
MAADEPPNEGAPALGAAAREALAQLFGADATNGEGPFVIVRPNGSKPIVAKPQFRREVDGRALLELERADLLWADSRDGTGRLKTFYLSPASLGLLNAALPVARESGPLVAGSPQPPGEGSGALNATQSPPRQRGRPKGTRSVPRDQIVEKFRALRSSYGRNPTQQELAASLEPRIEPRTLKAHLHDYGLPWPLE